MLFTAVAAASAATAFAQSGQPPVPYPEGHRGWYHVKTMAIDRGHPLFDSFGGIHHLYANERAMRGYRSGKFANGAVIVFDLLEMTKTDDHAIVEGPRKVLGVMRKDARRYAKTGGWGFEAFKGDSRSERVVGAKAEQACFGCHAGQKAKDYVFSTLRR
jgi:hypothetical protein